MSKRFGIKKYWWKAWKSPEWSETILPNGQSFIRHPRHIFLLYGDDGLIAVEPTGEFYGQDYKITNPDAKIKETIS